MARHTHTVAVEELSEIVNDPERGVISLVGDSGGISLITGPIKESGLIGGTLSVETEHGVVYLDPDYAVEISEDDGKTLSSDELHAVNDAVTTLLSTTFGWNADTDEDDKKLNELTRTVAAAVDDLINGTP